MLVSAVSMNSKSVLQTTSNVCFCGSKEKALKKAEELGIKILHESISEEAIRGHITNAINIAGGESKARALAPLRRRANQLGVHINPHAKLTEESLRQDISAAEAEARRPKGLLERFLDSDVSVNIPRRR